MIATLTQVSPMLQDAIRNDVVSAEDNAFSVNVKDTIISSLVGRGFGLVRQKRPFSVTI